MPNNIVNVCLHGTNMIAVDSFGYVYYRGYCMTHVVGSNKNTNEHEIIMTNVMLNKGESVQKFYASLSIVAFYTSEKKLYVLRNFNSKSSSNSNGSSNRSNPSLGDFDIDVIPGSEDIVINSSETKIIASDPTKIRDIDIQDAFKIYRDAYPMSDKSGFDLLETGVDDVLLDDAILFIKNSKLNVFTIKGINYMKYSSITAKIIGKPFGYYYQLLLPLPNVEQYVFGPNFVYMRNSIQQYVLSAKLSKSSVIIKLFQFDANLNIDVNNMVVLRRLKQLLINSDNNLCKYSCISHSLELIQTNVKKMFVDSNGIFYYNTIVDNTQLLHMDNATLKKTKQIPVKYNIIEYFMLNHHVGIIINIDKIATIGETDGVMRFNTNHVKYYGISSEYILFCDMSNTLNIFTSKNTETNSFRKISISNWNDKDDTRESTTYYVYSLSNFPENVSNIINIYSTNKRIIAQTKANMYNYNGDNNTFHIINTHNESISIDKSVASCGRDNYHDTADLVIDINYGASKTTNLFDKLLIMSGSLILSKKKIAISLLDRFKHKQVASGDGPTKEFINDALIDFSNKYLIVNPNKTIEYNMTTMGSFTDVDLVTIGNMLSYIIANHGTMPIRLPLTLLSTIQIRSPTNKELEYLLKIYDQDVYYNVTKYKYDPIALQAFGAGSYHEILRYLCKFVSSNAIKRLNYFIALGFNNQYKIPNIDKMNLPTLEYMMSGDFVIDKKKFVENIKFRYNDSKSKYAAFNKTEFKCRIESLSDDQFKMMLKNWSGSYVIESKYNYRVDMSSLNRDVVLKIQTCSNDLYINYNNDLSNLDRIMANLVDPIYGMRE